MNKKKSAVQWFILFVFVFAVPAAHAQNTEAVWAAADTTNFSRNANGGWQLYNSYVAVQGADSVRLELILQHGNNIDWVQEQYAGKIKAGNLRPNSERVISFSLAGINYRLRIDTNGKCYLKVASGAAPVNNPVILPFTVIYKK